jgi:putative spermidine/putrescine transport system ATP-binding protein
MNLRLPGRVVASAGDHPLDSRESRQPVIEFSNVRKMYGEHAAVANLNITVNSGEWLTLLGPSGCGKTTTLRMAAGFVSPDGGTICLQGADVTHVPPEKRGLGIVFQNYALFPHMTVADNVAFGLRRRHLSRQDVRDRVADALNLVQLTGLDTRKPSQLSGGQQQRVALARAVVIRPSALLLDEPLSNLDAALRDEMRVELRQLQRRLDITTLFVTHDQEEALALSDRVAVMNAGQCVQIGTPWEVYERPMDEFTARFLRFRNILKGREVAREAGWVDVELQPGVVVRVIAGPNAVRRDAVTIAIRPERLQLVEGGDLRGLVKEVTYLGEQARCLIESAVGLLTVATSAGIAPHMGDRVGVAFPSQAGIEVL